MSDRISYKMVKMVEGKKNRGKIWESCLVTPGAYKQNGNMFLPGTLQKCWNTYGKSFFFFSQKGNKISLEVTKLILVMTRRRLYHIVNGSSTPSIRSEEGLGRAMREGGNFLSIVTVGPQVEPGGQDRTAHMCYMPWSSENFRYCKKNMQETPESIQLEGEWRSAGNFIGIGLK